MADSDEEIEQLLREIEDNYERTTSLFDRAPAELANPARYIDLGPYRAEVREHFAPVVWQALQLIRRPDLGEAGRVVAEDLFARVSREALYAVTEIRNVPALKLLSQRYLSRSVYEAWSMLAKRGATQGDFVKLEGEKVQHEHVTPIEFLRGEIRVAVSVDAVRTTMERAHACVVTKREHRTLSHTALSWTRYVVARIDVWDRKEQRFLDGAGVAASSTTKPTLPPSR